MAGAGGLQRFHTVGRTATSVPGGAVTPPEHSTKLTKVPRLMVPRCRSGTKAAKGTRELKRFDQVLASYPFVFRFKADTAMSAS
jgi:hypothetical protein